MTKKMLKIYVDWYVSDKTVTEAIEQLKEFPADAWIENWGGDLSITYDREETDAEYEARLIAEKHKEEIQKKRDEGIAHYLEKSQYQMYLMLKARFEK